jgi:hypothetical protein
MNFDNLKESKIEIGCNQNLNNLYELYKSIILKIILANENTLYKSINTNLKLNLKNEDCNQYLSTYLEYTIDLIKRNEDDNINDLIFKIKNINNDKNEFIINKIIFLINEYYHYLDRSNLNVSTIEKYSDSLIKYFKEYYFYNKVEIFNIIKKK